MGTETFQPGDLIIGTFPVNTASVTIKSGAGVLARGTVLGQITADSKFIPSLAAAEDGSETPKNILAVDVDATSADVDAVAYAAGEINGDKLIIGTGHTVSSVEAAFRSADAPLFVKTVK